MVDRKFIESLSERKFGMQLRRERLEKDLQMPSAVADESTRIKVEKELISVESELRLLRYVTDDYWKTHRARDQQ